MDSTVRLILIIVLVLLVIGLLPVWGYSSGWGFGYFPSGLLGLVLIVLLVMALSGKRV
jgi:hypothetical protein